jgi:hypothetical protein
MIAMMMSRHTHAVARHRLASHPAAIISEIGRFHRMP